MRLHATGCRAPDLPRPAAPHDDIAVTSTAWAKGELRLAPNDIEPRWRLLDRYGGNRGWL